MEKQDTEIYSTQIFKANDMATESDLWLQFQIRELLNRFPGVSPQTQRDILLYEADRLKGKA
jgi:hypothetical protein